MTYRKVNLTALLAQIQGRLLVSCQALEDEPLFGSEIMARMAVAAMEGGAAGIRANTPADIAAIRHTLPEVPLMGIYKYDLPGFAVRITPTLQQALEIAEAGCDVVALDATNRPRPAESVADIIRKVKEITGLLVLADISTLEEALDAQAAGADMVSTTLSGYTDYTPAQKEPDLMLVKQLAKHIKLPIIAEGRIATPELAVQAMEAGAFAVVVGAAITRPQWITRQFVEAMSGNK